MVIAIIVLSLITLISLILFLATLVDTARKDRISTRDIYDQVLYNESLLEDILKILKDKKKES